MDDVTRKFIEQSYTQIQETLINLNNDVKNGDLSAEDFVKKRSHMIKEYQMKRKELEKNEV